MKRMRILLIGGTGFLSRRILFHTLRSGYEVVYLTRGRRPVIDVPGAAHIKADRNQNNLDEKLKNVQWDIVIDAICKTPEHGTQAVELARSCQRLIMISTDYVYDPTHRRLLQKEENAVYTGSMKYGSGKRKAELEIMNASKDGIVDATILRPPHIYGPGSNPGTIPKHGRDQNLIRDILERKPLRLIQGGLGLIQPIYVDDLARIILRLFSEKKTYGEIYNCPGQDVMTHLDYYKEIGKCLGEDIVVVPYHPKDEELEDCFPCGHRYYDSSKIKAVLRGFDYTPFKEGIHKWIKELMTH